jgi:hypothetical protein
MPRKKMLRIRPDPQPEMDVAYQVQVTTVNLLEETLAVTVKHASSKMAGVIRTLDSRLPLTPASLAATLFRACGIATQVDSEIDPQVIVGAVANAKFAVLPGDEGPRPIAFEPCPAKEIVDDQ